MLQWSQLQWEGEARSPGVLTAVLPGSKTLHFVQGLLCLSVMKLRWGSSLYLDPSSSLHGIFLCGDLYPLFPYHSAVLEASFIPQASQQGFSPCRSNFSSSPNGLEQPCSSLGQAVPCGITVGSGFYAVKMGS